MNPSPKIDGSAQLTINPERSRRIDVRVRFAPSPTGPLHIGGARTALFNWLFSRQNNGKFILRIEDTDIERSAEEYEKDIIKGLRWLGLEWDEGFITRTNADLTQTNADNIRVNPRSYPRKSAYIGNYGPYRQSERADIYEKYLKKLLDENKAYWCFCSKEELESDRQAMLAQGLAPKYSGRCRSISKEESEKRIERGEPAVLRFRVPEADVEFNDIVRGKIKFNAALIGDIVIAKNLRSPLYNFSAVVDDFEMKISHVIRGEEHLSNTPKQIFIQKALGLPEPKYAHIPLILASDRSKLSKRSLEISLDDYRKQGYLPEALLNFIALLGWHPKDDREILNRDELIGEFDLKRVQKAGAIFNLEKLEWFNSQYLRQMDSALITRQLKDFIPQNWAKDEKFLIKIINLEKERMKKLTDFRDLADFFFELPDYEPELLFWPRSVLKGTLPLGDKEKIRANLKLLAEAIGKIFKADFFREKLEEAIMPLTEVWGRGELLWPLRAALSGKIASPGPFEIMEVLGKEEVLRRINIALDKS